MAGFQTLPAPRVDPYAGDNARAVMSMMQILGQGEVTRRRKFMTENVLKALAAGGGTEGVSSAALTKPGYSSGISGMLQRFASPFADRAGGMDDIIAGQGIKQAFGRTTGTMPWAVSQMDPTQFKNYLDNYGRGVTVQTGERLLTESDRQAIAEVERDRKLGKKGPGVGISDKKAINADLDIRLEEATPFWKKGKLNLPEAKVYEQWLIFNGIHKFPNDTQKTEVLNTFKNKIKNKAGRKGHETDIDWTDPKWAEAIGLPAETKTGMQLLPPARKGTPTALPGAEPGLSNIVPLTATNPKTGERLMSNDGGVTWQKVR